MEWGRSGAGKDGAPESFGGKAHRPQSSSFRHQNSHGWEERKKRDCKLIVKAIFRAGYKLLPPTCEVTCTIPLNYPPSYPSVHTELIQSLILHTLDRALATSRHSSRYQRCFCRLGLTPTCRTGPASIQPCEPCSK